MTEKMNLGSDADPKTPDDLARLYQKTRVETPEALRAEIEARALSLMDEKPIMSKTSPRPKRYQNLIVGLSLAASLAIAVFVVQFWRETLQPLPHDDTPAIPEAGDFMTMRGSAWDQAIALRQRLLLEHPELAKQLSQEEQKQWETQTKQDCAASQKSGDSASESCLTEKARQRIEYLRETYERPAG